MKLASHSDLGWVVLTPSLGKPRDKGSRDKEACPSCNCRDTPKHKGPMLSLSLGNSLQPGLDYAWNELPPVKQDGGAPLWRLEAGGGVVTRQ